MSDLKALRVRIKSVKSTQKITKAMKVVSAAKLRGVRNAAERSAPYANMMRAVMRQIVANVDKSALPALMSGKPSEKTRLLIIVSGDRGLCGGFNSQIIKTAKAEIAQAASEGKAVKLMFIGKKAYAVMHNSSDDIMGAHFGVNSKRKIPFSFAESTAADIIDAFNADKFDSCRVIYTEFVNALIQKPRVEKLIPMTDDAEAPAASEEAAAPAGETAAKPVYEFEPDKETLLNAIIPRNIAVQLYHAVLESAASEHAARMTAMDNASRNASDMVARLTLQYNRSRQAAITKELIEVISGAESV